MLLHSNKTCEVGGQSSYCELSLGLSKPNMSINGPELWELDWDSNDVKGDNSFGSGGSGSGSWSGGSGRGFRHPQAEGQVLVS